MRGHFDILNDSQLNRLHDAAIRILGKVGMRVQDEEVLDLLSGQGAIVHRDSQVVKFPEKMLAGMLPLLKNDTTEPTIVIDGKLRQHLGGTANYYYDWREDKRRKATRNDGLQMVRLGESLDEIISVSTPVVNSEADPKIEAIESCALCIEYTRKLGGTARIVFPEQIKYVAEIGGIISGKPYDHRFISAGNAIISPLVFGHIDIQSMKEKIKYGLPAILLGTMPISGMSVPVTPAGTVVIATAEILGGWMVAKTINPDIKLGGACCSGTMDMATSRVYFSSPQAVSQNAVVSQIFMKFYGKRINVSPGIIDARVPGIQAVNERLFKHFYSGMTTNWGYSVGGLSAGNIFSPTQAMMDLETNRQIHKAVQGIDVDDDSLALEVIENIGVGPNRTYLDCEHTVKRFRDELWTPRFFDRSASYEDGLEMKKDRLILKKADEMWREALKGYKRPPIPEDTLKAVREVVHKAKRELLQQ